MIRRFYYSETARLKISRQDAKTLSLFSVKKTLCDFAALRGEKYDFAVLRGEKYDFVREKTALRD